MKSMDDIGQSADKYRTISSASAGILVLLFQTYLILLSKGFDILNFGGIKDEGLRLLAEIFVQIALFTILYSIVHFATTKYFTYKWINDHKERWLQGKWLHIHSRINPETNCRESIRVGIVDIKQDFDIVTGQGTNIFPHDADSLGVLKDRTTWSYILGRVYDSDLANDFIGYYFATNTSSQRRKDGVHELQVNGTDTNGYVNSLVGNFRDTHRPDTDKEGENYKHAGVVNLFRLSEGLASYLKDETGFRYDLLAKLHKEPKRFQDEPYVIELKRILNMQNHVVADIL